MNLYYVDGDWVEKENATISVNDLSVQRGIALFESIRTYSRVPFRLEDHSRRIVYSAEELFLEDLPEVQEIVDIVHQGIERNSGLNDMVIKLIITAGSGSLSNYGKSRLIVMFEELSLPSEEKYQQGYKLMSFEGPRIMNQHKHTGYLSAGYGLHLATKKGMDEILYSDGVNVFEIATGNIFIVKNHKLLTPNSGVLQGITKKTIIEDLTPELNLDVIVKKLTLEDLRAADEIFVTGSVKEVIAVQSIDEHKISLVNGPITSLVGRSYSELAKAETLQLI